MIEEAVAEQDAYLQARPDSLFGRKAMSKHLGQLADSLRQLGETDRALAVQARARSFWKQRPAEEVLTDG